MERREDAGFPVRHHRAEQGDKRMSNKLSTENLSDLAEGVKQADRFVNVGAVIAALAFVSAVVVWGILP